jgi:hypothetical protein
VTIESVHASFPQTTPLNFKVPNHYNTKTSGLLPPAYGNSVFLRLTAFLYFGDIICSSYFFLMNPGSYNKIQLCLFMHLC